MKIALGNFLIENTHNFRLLAALLEGLLELLGGGTYETMFFIL